jgi:hypothetical protein
LGGGRGAAVITACSSGGMMINTGKLKKLGEKPATVPEKLLKVSLELLLHLLGPDESVCTPAQLCDTDDEG